MNKVCILLFILGSYICDAQPLYLGKDFYSNTVLDSVVTVNKFHKTVGNHAYCEVSHLTSDTVYLQTKVKADTNSIVSFLGPITEFTSSVFTDTLTVPDTLKSYVKVYAYADSLGTIVLDSTSYVLMTYDPIVYSYSIAPIVGGYVSEVTINTGNARCAIKKQVALYPDTIFQFPFTYRNDTVFGVGVTLILRDTVKNLSSAQVALAFCDRFELKQLLSWNNVVLDTSDCSATLIAGAFPAASWFGSCSPTSSTITRTAVLDAFGQAGTLRVYIREAGATVAQDSAIVATSAVTGAQQQNVTFQGLLPQTSYELYGSFETSYGAAVLLPTTCVTDQTPSTLTNTIVGVTVGTNVNIQFSYTNAASHTCNLTVGYGPYMSSTLLYSNPNPGLANNGTLTATFQLPATVGTYTAHIYGYDEQTFDLSVEDTMHFQVSSLTGIKEVAESKDFFIRSIYGRSVYLECKANVAWIVTDIAGARVKEGKGRQMFTLPSAGMYFVRSDTNDIARLVID